MPYASSQQMEPAEITSEDNKGNYIVLLYVIQAKFNLKQNAIYQGTIG